MEERPLRPDFASRPVVALAPPGLSRAGHFSGVCQLGRVSEQVLHLRTLPKPSWYPGFLPFSPALLILWIPGLFRLTCYYYRGAYYKSFWADPPACAVGEPRKSYLGERSFPLILQNFHRYFLRLSYLVWGFLVYDAVKSFIFPDGFGIGVGSIVLSVNVVLLGAYVFGCHAFRHLIGGTFDRVSEHPVRHRLYNCVSCLNGNHKKWAWASLCSVGFADVYVRLCSMGIWSDWRIF